MADRPFLFLAANAPWVYALAHSLSAAAEVTTVQFYDAVNHRRLRPGWPEEASGVERRRVVRPPGYAGRLEPLFRSLMRRTVEVQRRALATRSGQAPRVVVPYPYLAPWVRQVPDEDLIYYNLDDYELYEPSRALRIRALEDELVDRAALTACLSVHQADRLAQRHPRRRRRIRHLPLGVLDAYLNPHPNLAPLASTVGYVGNLGDRIDWRLVGEVADRCRDVTFHVVGFLGAEAERCQAPWREERAAALARVNVIHEGGVPQHAVREHYWRYAVNWMPYAANHPFNLAACPTKIMDAIASGRPFVSTPVPEARLYPSYVTVAQGADGLAAAIARALCEPVDAAERIAYARSQTWARRAGQLRAMLSAAPDTAAAVPG
ncbi:glycosyltransferase [Acuticoccus sp.]|uniref:glycosyltransferase n=1 Tax=Acuticoccus sp. TaxID=1904378 RepID=UPI003B52970B